MDGVGLKSSVTLRFFSYLFSSEKNSFFRNSQKDRIFLLRFSDRYRDLRSLKKPLTIAYTQHWFLGE